MLRVAETKLDMDKVEEVVFYLGINDLNRNKQNPDIVRLNLAEAIVKVESTFPMAEVAVATKPPRKGKAAPVNFYNETTRDLNKYLELLTERNERLTSLNTYKLLCLNGEHVTRRLFIDKDQSGIHLSKEGSIVLGKAFLTFISSPSRKRQSDDKTPLSAEKITKRVGVTVVTKWIVYAIKLCA